MVRTRVLVSRAIAASLLANGRNSADAQRVLGAYLPEYRSYIDVDNAAPFLTDLTLFSVVPHKRGVLGGCCLEDRHFDQANRARDYKRQNAAEGTNSTMNVWVSVGGSGRSDWIVDVAPDGERRERLWTRLVGLCQKHGLVGVDFDCILVDDAHAAKGDPNVIRFYSAQQQFLREAAERLHADGLLVSVTLRPFKKLSPEAYGVVDRVNLMTYDMVIPGRHHALLENAHRAVTSLIESGCPPAKIVMGIPAYGRHVDDVNRVKTFSEIVDASEPSTVSDIVSPWQGYAFDDPSAVARKVSYADRTGLAGVFFWELGQDKQHEAFHVGGILLETAFAKGSEMGWFHKVVDAAGGVSGDRHEQEL